MNDFIYEEMNTNLIDDSDDVVPDFEQVVDELNYIEYNIGKCAEVDALREKIYQMSGRAYCKMCGKHMEEVVVSLSKPEQDGFSFCPSCKWRENL